jgi:hypothetical protein
MTRRANRTRKRVEKIAREAARYLDAVDLFAALGADPHAQARARAARARAHEEQLAAQRAACSARNEVPRWRS